MKEGSESLEKERKWQRKYFNKTKELLKKELNERREAVRLRMKKYRQSLKETSSLIQTTTVMSSKLKEENHLEKESVKARIDCRGKLQS